MASPPFEEQGDWLPMSSNRSPHIKIGKRSLPHGTAASPGRPYAKRSNLPVKHFSNMRMISLRIRFRHEYLGREHSGGSTRTAQATAYVSTRHKLATPSNL